ncbi:TonB-dependent receptor plug domain-containing protein [Flavobacterium sp. LT1R49]|uniref:TonB-dependent receptor plug domain-containing protein n=1 Tax=Flavobacterium arabinosi TaxID=3398737 RepID=UPI003A86FAC9
MKTKTFFTLLFAITYSLSNAQEDTVLTASKLFELSLEQLMNIEITTVSKKTEKVSAAPATVFVITQEDIMNRGYLYLKDVLRDLPGMETIENYFSEQGTLVPVRGVVGNNKIIVLVNGSRVNPPGGEEMMFRSDFNILRAKQIEIIYGPGSVLYGQDAISAVINVITEQPQEKIKVDVFSRGGMNNDKELAISISSRLTDDAHPYIGLSSSFSYINSDLSKIDKEYPKWWDSTYNKVIAKTKIRNTPYRFDKGFNGFLRLESENSSIQLWHRESSRSSAEGGYTPVLQFVNEAIWHDRTTVVSGTNKFNISDKVKLNASITYSRYEIAPESRYVFPINDSTVVLNAYKYGIGTGVRIEEQLDYEISNKISLTAGLLVGLYDIIPKATVFGGADPNKDIISQAGIYNYYTIKGDPFSKVELQNATNVNYRNYGAYIEGRFQLLKNLKAITGFRMDVDTRFTESPFSPRLALIYNPSEHFNIKYIFNKGYLAPAPYFSYNIFDNGENINTFNANLQAERVISNEINFNCRFKKLSLSSAFYYNTQQNLIELDDGRVNPANLVKDAVWVNADGTGERVLSQTANSGNTIIYGTDLFGTYKTEHFSYWASFSYVNYTVDQNNIKSGLSGISPVNIRFGLTWFPVKMVSITPSIIFRSTPDNIITTFGLDEEIKNPYQLNINMNYKPTKWLNIFINGTNITNHKYALKGVIGPTPQETIHLLAGMRFTYKE